MWAEISLHEYNAYCYIETAKVILNFQYGLKKSQNYWWYLGAFFTLESVISAAWGDFTTLAFAKYRPVADFLLVELGKLFSLSFGNIRQG